MTNQIIDCEDVSKLYTIGHSRSTERYSALRDVMVSNIRNLLKRTMSSVRGELTAASSGLENFWALKNVSFQVEQGDIVGIVGRNGAGKSTLLKILSRITEPTKGRVTLRGRVASLLEVGTGFHPELTGRENIFLNGAILGMRRAEIVQKFDEIVAFSEVGKFLDTPVKRYSSGMYVRLAFAVAAHLEPEILVVDEVLAVGDAEFQKKCLGKMQEATKGGRTVLFVSHNLSAVKQLCTRALLLQAGSIVAQGSPSEIAEKYLGQMKRVHRDAHPLDRTRPHVIRIGIHNEEGGEIGIVNAEDRALLKISLNTCGNARLIFAFTIFNSEDLGILSATSSETMEYIPKDAREMTVELPNGLLNPGTYRIEGALVADSVLIEQNESYCQFEVHRFSPFDIASHKAKGILRMPGKWSFF